MLPIPSRLISFLGWYSISAHKSEIVNDIYKGKSCALEIVVAQFIARRDGR